MSGGSALVFLHKQGYIALSCFVRLKPTGWCFRLSCPLHRGSSLRGAQCRAVAKRVKGHRMYFRVQYIIRDFKFGDAQISVSDPAKQIDVLLSKRPGDETSPPLERNQGIAKATCQRELPTRHHDEAVSSGSLSIRKEIVSQVHHDMYEMILHTIRLARWRCNSTNGIPNPIQWGGEFDWSVDGVAWKRVADNLHLKMVFSRPFIPWTNETAEFVAAKVLGDLDEPLGHQLLREAAANRKDNLRSSLVLAVVAAEVGFKQFASNTFPDTDWILEKLPSPPLNTMLQVFPWPKLGVLINGKVPSIPDSIQGVLKKAVTLRNQIVHLGVANLEVETVDSVITAVRDLLYFLDALRGQSWAGNYMSPDALKSLAES